MSAFPRVILQQDGFYHVRRVNIRDLDERSTENALQPPTPTPTDAAAREAQLHRALADPSRVRILEALREHGSELDAQEIADRVGLHANTVRSHVRVLSEAGLVTSATEERHRPGRPRIVYGLASETAKQQEPGAFRLLAEILASYIAGSDDDAAPSRAEQAGRAWGHYLVDRPAPFSPTSANDAIQRMLRLLEEFGFSPRLDPGDPQGRTILMHRCPFGEVAQEYRRVVCPVHLGLMQGALEELGAGVDAGSLERDAEGHCVAHLQDAVAR